MTDTSITATTTIAQMLALRQAALGAADHTIAEALGYRWRQTVEALSGFAC